MSVTIHRQLRKRELYEWQAAAIFNPNVHHAFIGGVGTGKTYSGAHFAIWHIENKPELTGFIGANSYDQLSQVTLMELFYWLDVYGMEYVIDRKPPEHWGPCKKLKEYHNVLSVRSGGRAVCIFTRVLSDGNPLRGLEFSWYWIDETRDTPKDTHNTILARMRESEYMKGLVTTTASGEDWVWLLFVMNPKPGFGAQHVRSRRTVEVGLHTEQWYQMMLAAYDARTAKQELDAEHINVTGQPAYASHGEHNHRLVSPFVHPSEAGQASLVTPFLPVTVGLDFNVTPMSWHLGQFRGPLSYWFDEIHVENTNTQECAKELVGRLVELQEAGLLRHSPQVKICGDATGESRNTKATQTDYDLICQALDSAGITWTNDTPDANPPVKTRVLTMNTRLKAATGAITFFYHPTQCPKLKRDFEQVSLKDGAQYTLDSGKENELTHASDSVGYPVCVYAPVELHGQVKMHVVPPRH